MSMMPAARPGAPQDSTNLADILERVLDRGVVIAGDIRVSLLDIELLTIKLRLVVASVDTAREMGIDWWERDPFLSSRPRPTPVGDGGTVGDDCRPALTDGRGSGVDDRDRRDDREEVS